MKRIEDIEKMSFEELEAIADDQSLVAPSELAARVDAAITAVALGQQSSRISSRRSSRPWIISTVTALALACMTLIFTLPQQPKDTFDDPALAYAELEKAFALIGSKVGAGMQMASQLGETMDKTMEVFNR